MSDNGPDNNQKPDLPNQQNWRVKADAYLTKLELLGVRAANKLHRGFVNLTLLFIGWNIYSFSV